MAKQKPYGRRGRARRTYRAVTPKPPAVTKPHQSSVLAPAWVVLARSLRHIWAHKRLFGGVLAVYGLLNLLFVQGFGAAVDVESLRAELELAGVQAGGVTAGVMLYGLLQPAAGVAASGTAAAYQSFFALIGSLAIIWALRQTTAETVGRVTVRHSYYRGPAQIVPFMLVLAVITIQLLPLVVASTVFTVVMTNSIAVHIAEQLFWMLFLGAALALSAYLISGSLLALYIVTLQDMTPMQALRTARKLVRGQRFAVIRKILFLPVVLVVLSMLLLIPIMLYVPAITGAIVALFAVLVVGVFHAYMFTLYRELL